MQRCLVASVRGLDRISINGDVGVWFRPSRTAQRVTQRVTRLFLAHSKGRFAADL